MGGSAVFRVRASWFRADRAVVTTPFSVCRVAWVVVSTGFCFLAGCGGDARLELAAADALLAVADQIELTVKEYHEEVSRLDESRESSVISAFIARVEADASDEAALESHASDFRAALGKIRADGRTEWSRRTAAMDNVGVVREVAQGLRKLAVESLTLDDEMRRYLDSWLEVRQQASGNVGK